MRLTARGRDQAAKLFAGHKRVMDAAAGALSKVERATLIRLVKKLGLSVATRSESTGSEV